MNVAIVTATCGDASWSRLAQDRAYRSARSLKGESFQAHVGHYPDLSVAAARNQLAKRATETWPEAEWLCFLDADDELEPDYLDAMAAVNAGRVYPELGAGYRLSFRRGDELLEVATDDGWRLETPPLLVPAVRYVADGQDGEAGIPNRGGWPEVNEAVVGTLVHRSLFWRVGGFREAIWEPCGACRGTGDWSDDQDCPSCRGVGEREVAQLPLYEDWDLWLRCADAGADLRYVEGAVYRAHVNADGGRNVGADAKVVYDAIWADHLARAAA